MISSTPREKKSKKKKKKSKYRVQTWDYFYAFNLMTTLTGKKGRICSFWEQAVSFKGSHCNKGKKLSTLVISNSKELSEILRDIRTSTYQICRIEEKIIRTTIFNKYICNWTLEVEDILKILWKRGEIDP